jgi:hypothetical protein
MFLSMPTRWTRRTTTLSALHSARAEVCPPSLRCTPASFWPRLLFWLLAPAPQTAAPPLNRLPLVRREFLAVLSDIASSDVETLRRRIRDTRSLRELWHARAELYRVVGVAHSQAEAERRLARLNHHFPTRAPRSQLVPL